MPPKAKQPAPIDRPLSRAYLREFSGWSTAYPPGASDPTSLRNMENVMINRDGSARVRPGLHMLTRETAGGAQLPATQRIVGSFEPFYLNDGTKAYLVAVKDSSAGKIRFRAAVDTETFPQPLEFKDLTEAGLAFAFSGWSGGEPFFTNDTTYVQYIQIDNKIIAMSNAGEPLIVFNVGATKSCARIQSITVPDWSSDGIQLTLTTNDWIASPQTTPPAAESSRNVNSLASNDGTKNVYNYAFFYTFENAIGESAPNQAVGVKFQRPWGGWSWKEVYSGGAPGEASSPGNLLVTDPNKAADQLIIRPDSDALTTALNQGATRINYYMLSWSDEAPVPVEGGLIAFKEIAPGMTHTNSWTRITPGSQWLNRTLPIPTLDNRFNYSDPPKTAQGLVAADRMVLVNDPTQAARIRWSSNQAGNYLTLSSSIGGGYKTLTSGNMRIPACVKLWQNPQSVDTLTVLCMGTDGYSSAYYMAPASVTSQSDNTVVMGFEETTATPGTVSPFGCEVANNSLYHPLADQLMKSTASNYNISHKSMTDQIANVWKNISGKDKIVSVFHDQRLYFLVHAALGEAGLTSTERGTEVWVLDLAAKEGTWSRWKTRGTSLKKITYADQEVVALVRPEGIYAFLENEVTDDVVVAGEIEQQSIAWKLVTNSQGANRAHDAWSHLKQANVTFGNFEGKMRVGVVGLDIHGRTRDRSKIVQARAIPNASVQMQTDQEDYLLVDLAMKEWFFYAESVEDDEGELQHSAGQITLVQYRYAPISVNVGYEYGTVESFEYGRGLLVGPADEVYDNGVPRPMIDPYSI